MTVAKTPSPPSDAHRIRCIVGSVALAAMAVGSFMLPGGILPQSSVQAAAAPVAAEVQLAGVVRDFRLAHVDFDVTPALGFGHVANNVLLTLDNDNHPVFSSGGDENGPFDARLAHWKFDDSAGSTASDELSNNPGTLQNGPTWVAGREGGAVHFDGTDDIVEIASSPEMQIVGDVTFSGWFKLDANFNASSPDTMVIMEKFLNTEADFHVALAGVDYNRPEVPKGSLVFKVEHGATSDEYCYTWSTRTSWAAGQWYHFAAALTSSDTSQNRLYVNASDDTGGRAVGIGFIDASFDAPMHIGGKTIDYNGMATDIYFEGAVDDVMIFDRALTPVDFTSSGTGFEVTSQWQDDNSNYIAPHLFNASTGGTDEVRLVSAPSFINSAYADSFDSSVGPYGGANIGPVPTWVTGAAMTPITVPTGLLWQDYVDYDGDATSTLSADIHCNYFRVENLHTLLIDGDRTIVADTLLRVQNNANIVLLPGATLTVYSQNEVMLENSAQFNVSTADPSRVKIYHSGADWISIRNNCDMYAQVWAPFGDLDLRNTGDFYGHFEGQTMLVQNEAAFHHDGAGQDTYDACGILIDDAAGAAGDASMGDITSTDSFDEWFDDRLGTNLSAVHSITLTDNGGVYEYLDDSFYPIDGDLFGNETMDHNHFFTYAISANFVYNECTNQFVEFYGGDGVWIFVNGELVIDLGGVASTTDQTIDLDRLGLIDGDNCTLDIFYANRHSAASVFRLRTNLDLATDAITAVTVGFD